MARAPRPHGGIPERPARKLAIIVALAPETMAYLKHTFAARPASNRTVLKQIREQRRQGSKAN